MQAAWKSVERILRIFAAKVSTNCRMEYDDAYQELAMSELNARSKFNIEFVTENGNWVTYETYLRRVLEGAAMKLIAKTNKKKTYSLDEMLSGEEDGESAASSNQMFIAYDEHRYKAVDWKLVIEQVAVDDIDVFIMEMLLEGWTQSEIADHLDFSQPAVRQRLNRYKEKMTALRVA